MGPSQCLYWSANSTIQLQHLFLVVCDNNSSNFDQSSFFFTGPNKFVGTSVRNNHAMDMSLCHGGVLIEHECACESRRIRVCRVGACHTIVESGHEREFVPPQPLVVWG
jgi:hypothetical protein